MFLKCRGRKNVTLQKLLFQVIKFVGFSGIGWVLDFCTYTILGFFSDNLVLNNSISSWVGVTFVFIFATRKVFNNTSKIPLKWKYMIYLLYQCALIFFISKLLDATNVAIVGFFAKDLILRLSKILAKVLVTPITMVLNFLIMKSVIEKI